MEDGEDDEEGVREGGGGATDELVGGTEGVEVVEDERDEGAESELADIEAEEESKDSESEVEESESEGVALGLEAGVDDKSEDAINGGEKRLQDG